MAACGTAPNVSNSIRIDQCGYFPLSEKMAFVTVPATSFRIVNSNGTTVKEGAVGAPVFWPEANDTIRQIDFTDLSTEGQYTIVVDDSLQSYTFAIGNDIFAPVAKQAIRAFYYNRTSVAIDSLHGGTWARPAGHPDTCVMVHSSAADKARPEGTILSSPGGWYDAGDYNKYIVNSGISTYTMLLATDMYENARAMELNIPESGNGIPDILNETLVNLRWMLTMQDPNDGGVYHKLTTLSFEGFIMPHECQKQRYVVAKGTAAALDFAATMAYAARMLPKHADSLAPLAQECAEAANRAYAWAEANPAVEFRNPSDVSTGEYGDATFTDEWFWASCEMWLLTGNDKYAAIADKNYQQYTTPSWGSVGILGIYSLALEGKALPSADPLAHITAIADNLVKLDEASPVRLSMAMYEWGSNSQVANEGMLKLIAWHLTDEHRYIASAMNDLHYILGRNGTGYSYVTGVGTKQPMHIHHRPSEADGIELPVPGFLAGGPNVIVPTDCGDTITRSPYPAAAYADQMCSYSTNEIAINWNAPLVFLLCGLQ